MLWRRYHFFFDADTLQEVYPENEIATWVFDAWRAGEIAVPEWRDKELSYEVLTRSFDNPWPRKLRSYEEELEVQKRRREWREKVVEGCPSEVPFYSQIFYRIFEGEELPRRLALLGDNVVRDRRKFWERRRHPDKAQYEAREPNASAWRKRMKAKQAAELVSGLPGDAVEECRCYAITIIGCLVCLFLLIMYVCLFLLSFFFFFFFFFC